MTDLQFGLLVLGAAAVVGVVVYNRLQERAVRREAERAFGARPADVLLDEGAAPPGVPRAPASVPRGALPDERFDYVVALRVAVGIPAAPVLEAWRPVRQRFGTRALLAGSDGSGWRALDPGELGTFSALRAALQIVSRGGVVSEAELVEFRAEVETLASRLRAECAAPQMRPSLDKARELDRLCADTDIQIALHVLGAGAGEALPEAGAAYEVSAREDGVTFLLDMPRTADPGRAYEAMARAAQGLAARVGGRLVDDRGQSLDERALAAIGGQLDVVRRRLCDHGIEPGSALALRLFS